MLSVSGRPAFVGVAAFLSGYFRKNKAEPEGVVVLPAPMPIMPIPDPTGPAVG